MARSERFASLAEVHAEKARLNGLAKHHGVRLEAHLTVLRNKEVRTALMSNSVKGMVRESSMGRLLGPLLGAASVSSGLSMAMGTGKGGWAKRLGLFVLGLAAPGILKKLDAVSWGDLLDEFSVSLQRTKEYMRKRRSGRQSG